MKVHEILRSIRLRKNLTLENLADELKINYTTYQSYEKDGSKIKIETLEKIATFYQLSLVELLAIDDADTMSFVLEPSMPFGKKKPNRLKVIVELDGSEALLEYWFKKLESINSFA